MYSINDVDLRTAKKSFKILKSKNIAVKKNLLKGISKNIYKNYFYSKLNKKPYLYGKLAMSEDKFLKDKNNFYITNDLSLKLTHLIRSKVNCILTTYKTINDDNPKLNCRIDGLSKFTPKVAILDKDLKINNKSYIVKNAKYNKTFLFYNSNERKKIKFLKSKKIILIHTPLIQNHLNFDFIIKKLSKFDISSVLIEAGKAFVKSLLLHNYFNEFYLFISPKILGNNGAFRMKNIKSILSNKFKKKILNETFLDKDNLIHYY